MWSQRIIKALALACCLGGAGIFSSVALAQGPKLSTGQTLYVASYSSVFLGGRAIELPLASTLIIRNTDPGRAITIKSIKYYGSQGQLVKDYLASSLTLPPLGMCRFPVQETDHKVVKNGASFLVQWRASRPVNVPLVECLMIGSAGQQGISFVSSAVAIQPAK